MEIFAVEVVWATMSLCSRGVWWKQLGSTLWATSVAGEKPKLKKRVQATLQVAKRTSERCGVAGPGCAWRWVDDNLQHLNERQRDVQGLPRRHERGWMKAKASPSR